MKHILPILFCCSLLMLVACDQFTYIPKSKKKQRQETPSVIIFDRMVDFRIEQGSWPVSRQDFISKGVKYYEVFNNFPYQVADFKVKDTNNMTFYFSGHIKDIERYNHTGVTDLNSFGGYVRFWKENDKFLWKIKMK